MFSLSCYRDHRDLHSFPTRRSSDLRRLGLSDAWLKKLEIASPNQRQVLSIVRLVGGSPAVGRLKQGDILLAIDEKVVTRFREVDRKSTRLNSSHSQISYAVFCLKKK